LVKCFFLADICRWNERENEKYQKDVQKAISGTTSSDALAILEKNDGWDDPAYKAYVEETRIRLFEDYDLDAAIAAISYYHCAMLVISIEFEDEDSIPEDFLATHVYYRGVMIKPRIKIPPESQDSSGENLAG
jgi:hypothetical protein